MPHVESGTVTLLIAIASAIYYAGQTKRLLDQLVEDVKELKKWRGQVEGNAASKAFVKSAGAH